MIGRSVLGDGSRPEKVPAVMTSTWVTAGRLYLQILPRLYVMDVSRDILLVRPARPPWGDVVPGKIPNTKDAFS